MLSDLSELGPSSVGSGGQSGRARDAGAHRPRWHTITRDRPLLSGHSQALFSPGLQLAQEYRRTMAQAAGSEMARVVWLRTLLLEGGGHINGAFLEGGLVDELSLLIVPGIDAMPQRQVHCKCLWSLSCLVMAILQPESSNGLADRPGCSLLAVFDQDHL